jgi:hypothetical protein
MNEASLLTDDEIVALCAIDGRPWPLGLITVGSTAEELTRAGMRGMRSLLVRQLAIQVDGSELRPHEVLARDIVGFLGATRRIGAYIASASDHSALAGAAVTAAQTSDGWLLDTVTATGVHALRRTSADDAAATVADMAEQAYDGLLFNDADDPAAWVCVVRHGLDSENAFAVGKGILHGAVDGSAVENWDAGPIRDAFRDA